MKSKYSICLIFFGMNRSLSQTFSSIDECILQPLKRPSVDIDVYASFMDPGEKFSNPRTGEKNRVVEYETTAWLNPVQGILTNQEKFDSLFDQIKLEQYEDVWEDEHRSTRNLFRQLYSIKLGYEAAVNSGKNYDYYFFFRPDLMYIDKFNFRHYLDCLESARGKGKIITPGWHTYGWLNDRYALCDKSAADIYAKRFDLALSYLKKNNEIHSERFLLDVLKAEKINYFTLSRERAARVRANHSVDPKDLKFCEARADSLRSRVKANLRHYGRLLKVRFR